MPLLEKQIQELRNAHKVESCKKTADKIKCIRLFNSGWSCEDVSEALLVDKSTLYRWQKDYEEGGLTRLVQTFHKGSYAMLTDSQLKILDRHLIENLYAEALDIVEYVKKKFNVEYTVDGMTKLLHRLNFSYKKPKIVPGKANAKKQKEFVEQYKQLKNSKKDADQILFMDGVHPQHNIIAGYGWIKTGQEKEIKSNTGRARVNINGAINIEEKEGEFVFGEAVNAQTTIELFEKLENKYPNAENIYVICDNAKYYRSKLVTEFLIGSKVEIIFLPPYSPNLNLIERFWKFFKKETLYQVYYETFNKFEIACKSFFRCIKSNMKKTSDLLAENFHIIGA